MSDFAITCRDLTKRYRRRLSTFTAVDALNLEVPTGATFGLLGPNGAGKTSTIHMLLGIVRPTSGTHSILDGTMGSARVRSQVGYVPEKFVPPVYLRAQEFLEIHGTLAGLRGKNLKLRIDGCLEMANLTDRRKDKIKNYSKGMQQRLVIAQAILSKPSLLILDEPTSALDPLGRRDVRTMIKNVRSAGTTVVLNSHLLSEVETVCDQVAILDHGRLVQQGTIETLSSNKLTVSVQIGSFPNELRSIIKEHDPDFTVERQIRNNLIEIRLHIKQESELPEIALAIHHAGVDLHSLVPERESLEELFVRMVDHTDHSVEVAT